MTAHLVPGTQYVADLGGGPHRLPPRCAERPGQQREPVPWGGCLSLDEAGGSRLGYGPRAVVIGLQLHSGGAVETGQGQGLGPGEQKRNDLRLSRAPRQDRGFWDPGCLVLGTMGFSGRRGQAML